jgi:multidrug resistance efflux pump
MRRLRLRPRSDTLDNDIRRSTVVWTRAVYFGILLMLGLWFGDFLFGSYLYLKSEGMVIAPSATISTEYPATVRDVSVREGDRVSTGQRIAGVSSQQVAESVARLTSDLARLRAQEVQLRIQGERNASLLGLASQRSRLASETRERYETLQRRGILPMDKRMAAMDSEYRSQLESGALQAETDAIEQQLPRMASSIDKAEAALDNLDTLYGRGDVLAPIDGIVGRRNVEAGTVITPGDVMIEIYGYETYVLAYVPTGTLYSVETGDRVIVEWGVRSATGRITAIEPVAMALPKEFQTAFKPVARNQLLRIEFDDASDRNTLPPLFAKVDIHGGGFFGRIFGTIF